MNLEDFNKESFDSMKLKNIRTFKGNAKIAEFSNIDNVILKNGYLKFDIDDKSCQGQIILKIGINDKQYEFYKSLDDRINAHLLELSSSNQKDWISLQNKNGIIDKYVLETKQKNSFYKKNEGFANTTIKLDDKTDYFIADKENNYELLEKNKIPKDYFEKTKIYSFIINPKFYCTNIGFGVTQKALQIVKHFDEPKKQVCLLLD